MTAATIAGRKPSKTGSAPREPGFAYIALLSASYVIIRLIWLATVPISEAPDEPNHLWVANFLYEHLRLPNATEVQAAGLIGEYGSLPQLGYLPQVILAKSLPALPFNTVARCATMLAGLPTVWIATAAAKAIFPERPLLKYALPLLVVLHPQLIFTQSYANTDATVVTLSSLAIYLTILSLQRGPTVGRSTAVGILMGWAVLSKHNSLSLMPPLVVATLAAGWLHGAGSTVMIMHLALLGSVFTSACGWWYWRNYLEFGGDVLGTRTMYATWSQILPHKNGQTIHPWPPLNTIGWWRFLFFDFWGLFGYMNRYLWRPLYLLYLAIFAMGIAGWCKKTASQNAIAVTPFTHSDVDCDQSKEDPLLAELRRQKERQHMLWLFLSLCPVFSLASNIYATVTDVSGPHGRYLFVAELPILAVMLAGLDRLGPRAGRVMVSLLVILCASSTLSGWLMYYAPH